MVPDVLICLKMKLSMQPHVEKLTKGEQMMLLLLLVSGRRVLPDF